MLTAAHCVLVFKDRPELIRQLYVRAGSSTHYSGGLVKAIRKVIVHNDYSRETLDYDIGMLILRRPLTFTNKVQPIALPPPDDIIRVNKSVSVSGWGFQQHDKPELPSNLHSVAVHIIDQESCNRAYARNSTHTVITNNMVCAGIRDVGGKDACQVNRK